VSAGVVDVVEELGEELSSIVLIVAGGSSTLPTRSTTTTPSRGRGGSKTLVARLRPASSPPRTFASARRSCAELHR
jgi:hypothetical protein